MKKKTLLKTIVFLVTLGTAQVFAKPVANFFTTKPFANPRFYLLGQWKNQHTLSFLTSRGFVEFAVNWPRGCRIPETGEARLKLTDGADRELLLSNDWFAVEVAAPSRFVRLITGGLDLECSSEVLLPLQWTSSEFQVANSLEPFLVFAASTQTFRGTQFQWSVVDRRLSLSSRLTASFEFRSDQSDSDYFGPAVDLEYFLKVIRLGFRLRMFGSLWSFPAGPSMSNWDLLLTSSISLNSSDRVRMKPQIGMSGTDWLLNAGNFEGVVATSRNVLFGLPVEVSLSRYWLLEFWPQLFTGKFDSDGNETDSWGWTARVGIYWALSDVISWHMAGYYGVAKTSKSESLVGAGTGLAFFF